MFTEKNNPLKENIPSEYFLSLDVLKQQPEKFEEYHTGDAINRENFVSYIIQSYAVSRGAVSIQQAFFAWIKSQNGFDSIKTLELFSNNGGWDLFSKSEKELFLSFFREIKAHGKYRESLVDEDIQIRTELKELGQRALNGGDIKAIELFDDYRGVHSLGDFNKIAGTWFKEHH